MILFLAAAVLIVVAGTLAILHGLAHPPRVGYGAAVGRGLPLSPGDMGLNFTERVLTLRDETTLPAWLMQGGCPQGPIVVMSHGWGESRYTMLRQAADMTSAAFQVVLYDMRGHGQSSAGPVRLGAEAEDLRDVLNQLDFQGHEVVLAGRCRGAWASLRLAGRQGGPRLAALVLESMPGTPFDPMRGKYARHAWPWWPFHIPVAMHMIVWHPWTRHIPHLAAQVSCPVLLHIAPKTTPAEEVQACALLKAFPKASLSAESPASWLAARQPSSLADSAAVLGPHEGNQGASGMGAS